MKLFSSKKDWVNYYHDFPKSFKKLYRWYTFMLVLLLVDVLGLTRYGLSVGFTEKASVTARLMEVNYWLGGLVAILVFGVFGLFLIFTKSRNLLIILSLVVFALIVGNLHALVLYTSGRLDPF